MRQVPLPFGATFGGATHPAHPQGELSNGTACAQNGGRDALSPVSFLSLSSGESGGSSGCFGFTHLWGDISKWGSFL